MKLKRTIALLAALAALLSLCSCAFSGEYDALSGLAGPLPAAETDSPGHQAEPDPFAEPTPEPTAEPTPEPTAEPTPEPTAEPTPEPTPKPTAKPTPKPTAKPTPEPTAEPTPEPVSEAFGAVEGGEYRNDYFGLRCTLPEGWHFLDSEALDGQVAQAAEDPALEGLDGEMEAFLSLEENACVAAAVSEDGLLSFNVVAEYLAGWGGHLTEADLCDMAMHQLGVPEDGDLAALGLEDGVMERDSFSFAGEEHTGLRLAYTDRSLGIDVPVYMRFVFLVRDEYALQITMGSDFDEDALDDVAALFTLDE